MAIKARSSIRKREIDLSGPMGNAFCLMGQARAWGKQLGWDKQKQDDVMADMMSGDYEHLLEVFDKHFGDLCDLVRGHGEDDEEDDGE